MKILSHLVERFNESTPPPAMPELPAISVPAGWRRDKHPEHGVSAFSGPEEVSFMVIDAIEKGVRIRSVLVSRDGHMGTVEDIEHAVKCFFGNVSPSIFPHGNEKGSFVLVHYSPDWSPKDAAEFSSNNNRFLEAVRLYHATRSDPRQGGLKITAPSGWYRADNPTGATCFRNQEMNVVISEGVRDGVVLRLTSITRRNGQKVTSDDMAAVFLAFLSSDIFEGATEIDHAPLPDGRGVMTTLVRRQRSVPN